MRCTAQTSLFNRLNGLTITGKTTVKPKLLGGALILILENDEEIRDGIKQLLKSDGYRVDPARTEHEAVLKARRDHPDLILVSLGEPDADTIAVARRARRLAELTEAVLIVIFSIHTIAEGAETNIGKNVHLTRPDNFDRLRRLLRRLLR